mgnify:CR=1 FL=1
MGDNDAVSTNNAKGIKKALCTYFEKMFSFESEQIDKFGIEIGARMGLDLNRKTELSLEYKGVFKGDYTNHTGLATVKYKF